MPSKLATRYTSTLSTLNRTYPTAPLAMYTCCVPHMRQHTLRWSEMTDHHACNCVCSCAGPIPAVSHMMHWKSPTAVCDHIKRNAHGGSAKCGLTATGPCPLESAECHPNWLRGTHLHSVHWTTRTAVHHRTTCSTLDCIASRGQELLKEVCNDRSRERNHSWIKRLHEPGVSPQAYLFLEATQAEATVATYISVCCTFVSEWTFPCPI
eukprot:SAG25_NODE_647_length_6214_cov_5.107277_9_plen_209_part_00